jgi:hypothetical protein
LRLALGLGSPWYATDDKRNKTAHFGIGNGGAAFHGNVFPLIRSDLAGLKYTRSSFADVISLTSANLKNHAKLIEQKTCQNLSLGIS